MDLPLFSISAWWGWGARGTGRGFLALYQWFGSSFPSLQSRWWGYDTNCSAALTGLVCQLSVLVLTLSSSKTSLLLKLERKENVLLKCDGLCWASDSEEKPSSSSWPSVSQGSMQPWGPVSDCPLTVPQRQGEGACWSPLGARQPHTSPSTAEAHCLPEHCALGKPQHLNFLRQT